MNNEFEGYDPGKAEPGGPGDFAGMEGNAIVIERCNIQEYCCFPLGHRGNCERAANLDLIPPCEPHDWPGSPEYYQSGKVSYEICPRCHCVEQHIVHGWKPIPDQFLKPGAFGVSYGPNPEWNRPIESVEFLLSRICTVIPEPSLMDIDEGGASQSLLLMRAQTLAQLHQAKQLEGIRQQVTDIAIALEAGLARILELFESTTAPKKPAVHKWRQSAFARDPEGMCTCGFMKDHPVHAV